MPPSGIYRNYCFASGEGCPSIGDPVLNPVVEGGGVTNDNHIYNITACLSKAVTMDDAMMLRFSGSMFAYTMIASERWSE